MEDDIITASVDASRAAIQASPTLNELRQMAEARVAQAAENMTFDLLKAVYELGFDHGVASVSKES